MKNLIVLYLTFFLSTLSMSQIKGNSITVSRQNVNSKKLGNGIIYGNNTNNFTSQNLSPNPVISIDVKAICNVVADSYTAVFNVNQIGKTSEETNKLIKERTDNLRNALVLKGVSTSNFIIDVISFVPVYETVVDKKIFSKKYVEVPTGFELQQNIHIKFTKINQFEDILAACANNEIYNLVKVDYFFNNIKDIYNNLRLEIVKELKLKQEFYTNLGFNLTTYKPIIADNKYCYFPRDLYKSYQAYNSTSMEVLKKKQGVAKAKKQTSYYYDPIPFRDFDIVINSSIVEPVIQIGMEIRIQYSPISKEKQKPIEKEVIKNKYYLISPDGSINIQEFKV